MPTGELELFKKIWAERVHESFISGRPLMFFDVCFFAHVLPKGTHPQSRLDPENIVLLTREEHNLLDQGTMAQREKYGKKYNANWDLVRDLKIKLFRKYYPELNQWEPKNL